MEDSTVCLDKLNGSDSGSRATDIKNGNGTKTWIMVAAGESGGDGYTPEYFIRRNKKRIYQLLLYYNFCKIFWMWFISNCS